MKRKVSSYLFLSIHVRFLVVKNEGPCTKSVQTNVHSDQAAF